MYNRNLEELWCGHCDMMLVRHKVNGKHFIAHGESITNGYGLAAVRWALCYGCLPHMSLADYQLRGA